MIVIYTNDSDTTSDEVQDWLTWYGYTVRRVNNFPLDFDNFTDISFGDSTKVERDYLHKDDVVWFRRWNAKLGKTTKIQYAVEQEQGILKKYLAATNNNCFIINKPTDLQVTKIDMLSVACKVGLIIPQTIITSSKISLLNFREKHEKIITKPLSDPLVLAKHKATFASYTRFLEKEEIDAAEPTFLPSMFQEYIDKKFEIRAFLLNNDFYCMAIFSQDEEAAKVDYRKNPHHETPLKCVPYKLPAKIEVQLSNLMSEVGLNTGSIDLILDKDGKYIFLEVNPVGQYAMTSVPCNYFIDKKIAQLL
ncbi:MAG: grasp-with-spasm system ATP-grasp peptide maturase [Tenuifilaceae bacterium]|nr:grasp-with-spasm system ATP-grasp peptide maturase [Tenuifilaceae bacterium]